MFLSSRINSVEIRVTSRFTKLSTPLCKPAQKRRFKGSAVQTVVWRHRQQERDVNMACTPDFRGATQLFNQKHSDIDGQNDHPKNNMSLRPFVFKDHLLAFLRVWGCNAPSLLRGSSAGCWPRHAFTSGERQHGSAKERVEEKRDKTFQGSGKHRAIAPGAALAQLPQYKTKLERRATKAQLSFAPQPLLTALRVHVTPFQPQSEFRTSGETESANRVLD